jgi:hypothetical protein
MLMVSGVEQDFVQASPVKYLATFCALREVLLFVRRELLVFVECHRVVLDSRYETLTS